MLIAAHKAAEVPKDPFYLPVHVGHALNPDGIGYQPDDEGDNISAKNRSYCELTATYWAWKNLDCPIIGLSHYRRYFRGDLAGPGGRGVLSMSEAEELMDDADVVMARPRDYVIETIEQHYAHAHVGGDLDVLRAVVAGSGPGKTQAYDRVFSARKLSLYNMFLMKRDAFQDYAEWVFSVLEQTEAGIDLSGRDSYQSRVFGYLGERLLNVWAASRPDLKVRTRRVVNTEGEPKLRKAYRMAMRKVMHDRAGASAANLGVSTSDTMAGEKK